MALIPLAGQHFTQQEKSYRESNFFLMNSLAGMLHKVGLLPTCNHQQVPFAYKMYTQADDDGWKMSNAFKRTFSIDVDIEFLGVWYVTLSLVKPIHLLKVPVLGTLWTPLACSPDVCRSRPRTRWSRLSDTHSHWMSAVPSLSRAIGTAPLKTSSR